MTQSQSRLGNHRNPRAIKAIIRIRRSHSVEPAPIIRLLGLIVIFWLIWYSPLIISLSRARDDQKNVGRPSERVTSAYPPPYFDYKQLGIRAPVVISPGTSPLVYQSWSKIRSNLTSGVALAFEEDEFSQARLVFLTGHSADRYPHRFGAIFAGLWLAEVDDVFKLSLDDQRVYEYQVIDKKIIPPRDVQAFEGLASADSTSQRVALVTCWPLLTTKNRLVVIGERKI